MLFEFEAETAKELFRQLAEVQSIFEADKSCGRCDKSNLQFRVRAVEDGDYYELVCLECLATLRFGQPRKGGLWPKRKDKEGNILSHRGWRVAYGKVEQEPDFAEEMAGPAR
jgi:hypothetical protein